MDNSLQANIALITGHNCSMKIFARIFYSKKLVLTLVKNELCTISYNRIISSAQATTADGCRRQPWLGRSEVAVGWWKQAQFFLEDIKNETSQSIHRYKKQEQTCRLWRRQSCRPAEARMRVLSLKLCQSISLFTCQHKIYS